MSEFDWEKRFRKELTRRERITHLLTVSWFMLLIVIAMVGLGTLAASDGECREKGGRFGRERVWIADMREERAVSFDSLGDRMKAHEEVWRASLPPRTPVIIRIDGRAFHTYTIGLERPFSEPLIEAMNRVAVELCEQIQGARIAYVQSDEINLLLHSYETFTSQAWFGNDVQKMASVAAGIASATMTRASVNVFGQIKPAVFDARVYALPEHEVTNYFLWRQNDASRNSVQMLARSLFSHSRCNGLSQAQLNELCFTEGGRNWNDLPTSFRRGRCVVRVPRELMHWRWEIDNEIPIWKGDGRAYIERLLVTRGEAKEAQCPTP